MDAMPGNAIKIAPLVPILSQPMVTTHMTPINLENVNLNFTVPNNVIYNSISNPLSLIVKPSLPITVANAAPQVQPLHMKTTEQANNAITNVNQVSIPVTPPRNNKTEVIYQVVNPEDLNLRFIKRGRKKSKPQDKQAEVKNELQLPPVKAPRTRSGRIVKTPKHIEKDFEKIITSHTTDFKTEKFAIIDDKHTKKDLQVLQNHFKKKTISSQYRCSICNKAYLSKRAVYLHLLKNPDHSPPPDENNNFDVWNYLVDITQKRPSGQRGVKFCDEITNLLHNLQLLTGALFKTEDTIKNNDFTKSVVQIDKILGNAVALQPGKYYFDENELYKDVTVLKLITNSQFFAPKKALPDSSNKRKFVDSANSNIGDTENPQNLFKENNKTDTTLNVQQNLMSNFVNSVNDTSTNDACVRGESVEGNISQITGGLDKYNHEHDSNIQVSVFNEHSSDKMLCFPQNLLLETFSDKQLVKTDFHMKTANDDVTSEDVVISRDKCISNFDKSVGDHIIRENFSQSPINDSPDKTLSFPQNLLTSNTIPDLKSDVTLKMPNSNSNGIDSFSKTLDDQILDTSYKKLETSLSLHSDLLSDNSLLALPHLRTSDDEMMLTGVDTGTNLLDNSTSSDEVMNVDQFVNERFKKITEPDTDLKFNTSLNLDLPSLELFEFHTS